MKKLFLVLMVLSLFAFGASAQVKPFAGPAFGPQGEKFQLLPLMPMYGFGRLPAKPVVLNGTLETKDGFQFVRVGTELYALILPRLLGLTFDTPRVPYAPNKVVIQGYIVASSVVVMDMVVDGVETFQRTPMLKATLLP